MKLNGLLALLAVGSLMVSCSSRRLETRTIAYQSLRVVSPKAPEKQKDAEIAVAYTISADGQLNGKVFNLTDDILTINQATSFIINVDGTSVPFYDPNTVSTTVTDVNLNTRSSSYASLWNAIGLSPNGYGLEYTNTYGSIDGTVNSTTVSSQDTPVINVGPKGNTIFSREFNILGVGAPAMWEVPATNARYDSASSSPVTFNILLSYSTDGGTTYKQLRTTVYVNSQVVIPLDNRTQINDRLRGFYTMKPDALNEQWWMLCFPNNVEDNPPYDRYAQGVITDFQ